jgi:hypothetical protein
LLVAVVALLVPDKVVLVVVVPVVFFKALGTL